MHLQPAKLASKAVKLIRCLAAPPTAEQTREKAIVALGADL
jgi:hypothetical protein